MPSRPTPPFARMRVGTKLLVLALLPVCVLLALAVLSAVAQWHEASRLRDFRAATRLSFLTAGLADRLAGERTATVLLRERPGAAARTALASAHAAVDAALQRAAADAGERGGAVDVAGRLDAGRRQLDALRIQAATGSLSQAAAADAYGEIVSDMLETVRELDAGRPSRASGRAADAYLAILQAIEAAERERVELATLLATRSRDRAAVPDRWVALEAAELDAFRQNAGGRLTAGLDEILFRPPGVRVQRLRDELASDPRRAVERASLNGWLAASGARISALRSLERTTAASLATTAFHDLDGARARATRELALSLAVLVLVTALALALRRSITRPLAEVSRGARTLSRGDLTFDVGYAGRDEIGDVATAFRDLHVTAERLAGEIRELNAAVRDNRLDHRADIGAFQGTWSQLLGGLNDTMAAFTELHQGRRRAERESERIFNLSLDLLCVAGTDGYFKRVNPAFSHTLGYTSEQLLSKPYREFIHPEDRERSRRVAQMLARGDEIVQFEDRYIRRDGSVRWLQWSARPVPEEGLIYAAGRDVTNSRRAGEEQAALRRVATLVARGVAPSEVFGTVAIEVGGLLDASSVEVIRYEPDGSVIVLGSATGGGAVESPAVGAKPVDGLLSAPIVVADRAWGAIVVASAGAEPLPGDAEARLARFTDLVATAIANAESRAQLAASRARVVTAGDEARRRIERDLHDGVQQRLVSVALELRTAEAMVHGELKERLSHIVAGLTGAFDDLREIAAGIHPQILSRAGLGPALKSLARRAPVPVELDLPVGVRLPERVEVAAYYVVSEALTNVAKHARASVVHVDVAARDGRLELSIRDDGIGGANPGRGSGLIGLTDRVEALGGTIAIASPPGGGTALLVTLPSAGAGPAPALGERSHSR